ncbi:tautomerase family protein [Streptomyces actuosus]|uniref:Tautomerase family protein n=2 Tax=Streptomyces actuosus TaxID=1885 RepID=A0ABS2VZC6_STRAS|nr:tautomerase family protein [Streptomyces actuosus]
MTKIYLRKGKSAEHKRAISDAIHAALVAVLGIPDDDKYHVFHELEPDNLITAPVAFGLERRPQAVFVQMYFGHRPEETLKELYRTLVANLLEGAGLETRDIYLNVVESPSPNWWADGRILDPVTRFDTRIAADKVPTER